MSIELTQEYWNNMLLNSGLPRHMHFIITSYILYGHPPGEFLQAVLSNDLRESVAKADHLNRERLPDYVEFFYNRAPAACWGVRKKMEEWVSGGGLAGLQVQENAITPVSQDVAPSRQLIRRRFHLIAPDPRPVNFPPPGPYWVTAQDRSLELDAVVHTMVVIFPEDRSIQEFWPEAPTDYDFVQYIQAGEHVFNERFPCPSWWDATKWEPKPVG